MTLRKLKIVAASSVICLQVGAGHADGLRFAAGPQGSDAYAFAGAIVQILDRRLPELALHLRPSPMIAGPLLVEDGQVDLAMTFSIASASARAGSGAYRKPAKNVCAVASFVPHAFQMFVRADSDINLADDLPRAVAAFRSKGGFVDMVTSDILQGLGVDRSKFARVFYGSRGDGAELFTEGEADLFVLSAAVPAPVARDIAARRAIRLIGLPREASKRIIRHNAGYVPITIPSGSYLGQTKPVETIGYLLQLVARCDLPAEQVMSIAAAISSDFAMLRTVSIESNRLVPGDLAVDMGVPFHAGALAALRAAGLR
jgi:hypothetical protein